MRALVLAVSVLVLGGSAAVAQETVPCRVLCAPALKVEPTITRTAIVGSHGFVRDDGAVIRDASETEFEVILSLGLSTRLPWLAFTVEAIVVPFDRQSTPELEFEANLVWLPAARTKGWLSSHVDIVDKFSPAERSTDRRAYTHKLNLELDTSLSVFNWLPEGRWLRGVELEGSLDYVASGLPRAGDIVDGRRYLDNASPWSFSLVIVLPIAPL